MSVDYELLTKPFPPEAIKRRPDGYAYVDHHYVMERLRLATGNRFDLRTELVSVVWHDATSNEGKDISHNLYTVKVALEIDGCHREQFGTSRDYKMEDDAIKAAVTDGLKKCLTLWGVGVDLDAEEGNQTDRTDRTDRTRDEAPPKMVNPDGPATEKQLSAIQAIRHNGTWKIRTKAWDKCTEGMVGREYSLKIGEPGNLTKREASALLSGIGRMKPEQLEALPLDPTTQQTLPEGNRTDTTDRTDRTGEPEPEYDPFEGV